MSRLSAWKTAWLVAVNRPLVGGGFQIIDDVAAAGQYNPEFTEDDVGAHSIYFEVLGENGFLTLAIFLYLLLSCMTSLRKLRRAFMNSEQESVYYYAKMLEVGLAGYAVSGLFLEMASFDLFYQYVALTIVLKKLSRNALQNAVPESSEPRASTYLPPGQNQLV